MSTAAHCCVKKSGLAVSWRAKVASTRETTVIPMGGARGNRPVARPPRSGPVAEGPGAEDPVVGDDRGCIGASLSHMVYEPAWRPALALGSAPGPRAEADATRSVRDEVQ